jgi:hypothetical protein
VAFGGLTGADVKLNVQSLYSKQIKLIGSTGGARKDLERLSICLKNSKSEFGRDSSSKMQKKLYKPYLQKKEMAEFY